MKLCSSAALIGVSPLILASTLLSKANPALAQITPDNTLGAESSTVNPRDETSDSIQGGAVRGQNLFHSFQDFNVDAGRGVYFANPDAVNNIFSRVTGDKGSNILGTLGVDGAANLYLVNPNGIVFGEGASLDVQGSFTATTADAIEFGEGGLFSAVTPGESLLTISVPLGLQFGSTPGSIVNRSFMQNEIGDFVGLQVPDEKNLTLVGGDIKFETGIVTARGGNIHFGGLAEAGIVNLNANGNLSFSESQTFANISLTNGGVINVKGTEGGNVTINAQNLTVEAEEFSSFIRGGITADSTSANAQAGDIVIKVTEDLTIDRGTISNQVDSEAIGNAGNISITTGALTISNEGIIEASTFGRGDAGNIEIAATETIAIDEVDFNGSPNGVSTGVNSGAIGNAGNLIISANSLSLSNGGQFSANTLGIGNAGEIKITATDSFVIDRVSDNGVPSGVFGLVNTGAEGSAEGINISTGSLEITNGGQIDARTDGIGNAGEIAIKAKNRITVDGTIFNGFGSGIFSQVDSAAIGNAKGVALNADSLVFTNGGTIDATALGKGNAGRVEIIAANTVTFDGDDGDGVPSGIYSFVTSDEGNAGGINIVTKSLALRNGGQITAFTASQGDAGEIVIDAKNNIVLNGVSSGNSPSSISSQVAPRGSGNSNGININTDSLTLLNGGIITASTLGQGNAGLIDITATSTINFDGENSADFNSGVFSIIASDSKVETGGINITTDSLILNNGGQINSSTTGVGNAGSINITATDTITFDGMSSDSLSSGVLSLVGQNAVGNGGGINITTDSLNLANEAIIDASTSGQGNAGGLEINANNLNLDKNAFIVSRSETSFDAGDITLKIASFLQATDSEISTLSLQSSAGNLIVTAGDIELRGNSNITTNIFSGKGSGGNINITADSIIAFDDSDILASAPEGQGGNITLDTSTFFAENFTFNSLAETNPVLLENNSRADVNATGAVSSGAVNIPDVSFIQNSLTELPDNSINTNELVANSCVVPSGERGQGNFIITGGESLPVRPGDDTHSTYPTGEVRGISEDTTNSWQPGDPIVEPQGAYRLANGQLVLSRECSQQ